MKCVRSDDIRDVLPIWLSGEFLDEVYIDQTKTWHVSFLIGLKIVFSEITSLVDLLHVHIDVSELTSDEKHGDEQFSSQNYY